MVYSTVLVKSQIVLASRLDIPQDSGLPHFVFDLVLI